MRFFLFASLVLGAAIYAEAQSLPHVLIERAQAIIHKAESVVKRHHEAGHQHLTKVLENEIHLVRALEQELIALSQERHMELHEVLDAEVRLLAHENKLAEETEWIEKEHKKLEDEHKHEHGHEHRNREGHDEHHHKEGDDEQKQHEKQHAEEDREEREHEPTLPEVLIHRAREIIKRAEADLHRHHQAGRSHLTHELEKEIEKVREIEHQLMSLEQHKHVDAHHVHFIEIILLAHENKLAELSAIVEHEHKREQEHHHEKPEADREDREHEHKEEKVYEDTLPEVLIHRAREIIKRAEADLHRHHQAGRSHLTHALEKEIEKVREIERQLMSLEHHKHVDAHHVHFVELVLMAHENKLAELSAIVEHEHKREQEHHHDQNQDHEHKEHKQVKRAADDEEDREHEHREHEHREHEDKEEEHKQHRDVLPIVLIHRAREIIKRAEADLHRHHQSGRSHLTHAMEREIEIVRHLEKELLALEQHKHLDVHHLHEVELRLLAHENILEQETAFIEHLHKKEQEEREREHEHREHEHREHEHEDPKQK